MQRKNIHKRGVIALTAVFALSLAGLSACQQTSQSQTPPTQVVQDGMKKLTTVTSHQFALVLSGNLNGPQGQKPALVKFNANLNGSADMKDPLDPKINLQLDGSADADGQGGTGSTELRMNKDALYFTLASFQPEGDIGIPSSVITQYVGKWWQLPIPADALKQLMSNLPEGGSQQTMTPAQQKVKDLFVNTQFFKNLQYVGVDNIKGEQSSHYSADLDKDAFMNFAVQAAAAQGQPMAAADKQSLTDAMQKFNFSGNIWVGQNSGILNQVTGNFTFVSTAPTDPTGTISVSLTLWNFNQPVTVVAPANAQLFPVDQLMGLLGGGTDTSGGLGSPAGTGASLDQSSLSGLSPAMTQQVSGN